MEEAVREHARVEFKQEVWDELVSATHYVPMEFEDDSGEDRVAAEAQRARQGARHGGQPPLLPRRAAERDRDARPRDRRAARDRRLGAVDRREAVRAGPRLRAPPERGDPPQLRRERDLPDRPLPRQGDRPEHARAAVRERDLRAALVAPVRRPRADHGRRVDRDRRSRCVLRAGGRDPRRPPEPPAAAARTDCDGAADRLRRRRGAQREGEGAARDRGGRRRPGAVRPRVHRGQGGSGLPRGGRHRSGVDHRDLRCGEAPSRHVALGRHAVLRPDGQAARQARDDDRGPVQARSAVALHALGRSAPERARDSRATRRGRLARDRREGAGPGHDGSHGEHGLPLRRGVPNRAARGVRAADPRRDARRPDAVHARGRDRGAVAGRRLDPGALGRPDSRLPELRRRDVGARGARTS